MTSRSILSDSRTLEKDGSNKEQSDTTPPIPATVIIKLLGFTAAMVIGPIGTYFMTLNIVFRGNSTWAGATAALVANVVLIAYVIVAFKDDESDRIEAERRAKKAE